MAISAKYHQERGYIGDEPDKPTHDVMVFDNVAHKIHSIVVHKFSVGDVEDPDLYAGQPLYEWQNSDDGRWVMENAVETPVWHRHIDQFGYGYQYAITAKFRERDAVLWTLKH